MSGVSRSASLLLLLATLAFPIAFMARKSVTGDEIAHLPAGYSYLVTGRVLLNPMHPPLIKELCALPLLFLHAQMPLDPVTLAERATDLTYQWPFGQAFLSQAGRDRLLFWGRVPAVILSFGLAIVVLHWATELWGTAGGLLALALSAFDPTIDAHAQLVTTDVGLAFFATLFLYLLRRHLRKPNLIRLIAAGLTLGLTLGAKFSGVVLVPVSALLLAAATPLDTRPVERIVKAFGTFVALLLIAYCVLWVVYLFPRDPLFYLQGLRTVQADNDPRFRSFLMGKLGGHRLAYFPIAFLVKTPIPSLILLAMAVVLFLRGRRLGFLDELFLIAPTVCLFVGYVLRADQIGVRYLIPCLPLLFIFAGRVASITSRKVSLAVAALLVWYVAEFAAISPDQLSYFNQIAGGSSGGVRWLDDSNVDWGQGLIQLRHYVRDHPVDHAHFCCFGCLDPKSYGIDFEPIWISGTLSPPAGTLILSAHCVARASAWLTDEYGDGPRNWLAHTAPRAIVGHTYYIYENGP